MNDTLDELASSIGGAHAAVDEIAEHVDARDDDPSNWRVGLTDEPPQTGYDGEPPPDASVVAVETSDVSSARYALRELFDRGFKTEEIDNGPDGRFVYAYEISEAD